MNPFNSLKIAILTSLLFMSATSHALATFNKVMIVILENSDYVRASQQAFLTDFANRGASLNNMSGITHPSLGNYVAMISGDTFGIKNDDSIDLDGQHIGDLLEAKGLTWKVYAEDYPGNCFLGATSGNYARKHIPFLSFKNVSTNKKRCANIVNANQFDSDVKSGNIPNYSFFVPNLKNDGHNAGVNFADHYLENKFGPLLKDSKFMNNMLFIITFDESQSKSNSQIYTAVYGDSVIQGATSTNKYNHYSILKTIEMGLGLKSLNKNDSNAQALTDVLKK